MFWVTPSESVTDHRRSQERLSPLMTTVIKGDKWIPLSVTKVSEPSDLVQGAEGPLESSSQEQSFSRRVPRA